MTEGFAETLQGAAGVFPEPRKRMSEEMAIDMRVFRVGILEASPSSCLRHNGVDHLERERLAPVSQKDRPLLQGVQEMLELAQEITGARNGS